MALTLASFSKPDLFAFHLTERVNMARIERLSLLESAERLYRAAGEDLAELRRPRRGPKSLVLGGETIHLRDHFKRGPTWSSSESRWASSSGSTRIASGSAP